MACTAHAQECSTCHFCYPGSSCEGGQLKKNILPKFLPVSQSPYNPQSLHPHPAFPTRRAFSWKQCRPPFWLPRAGRIQCRHRNLQRLHRFPVQRKGAGRLSDTDPAQACRAGCRRCKPLCPNQTSGPAPAYQKRNGHCSRRMLWQSCGECCAPPKSPKTPSNHPPACNPGSGGRGRGKSFPRLPLPRLLPVA